MNSENIYKGTIKLKSLDKMVFSDCILEHGININKDGIETIFYKLVDEYIDLKTKKTYKKEEITNLVKLNQILNIRNNISRKKTLKLYEQDLESLIKINNLYIADIAFIYRISNEITNNEIIESNKLLLKKGLEYLDLESYNSYRDEYKVGKIAAVNIRPFIDMVKLKEEKIKKVKAINYYRKMF